MEKSLRQRPGAAPPSRRLRCPRGLQAPALPSLSQKEETRVCFFLAAQQGKNKEEGQKRAWMQWSSDVRGRPGRGLGKEGRTWLPSRTGALKVFWLNLRVGPKRPTMLFRTGPSWTAEVPGLEQSWRRC